MARLGWAIVVFVACSPAWTGALLAQAPAQKAADARRAHDELIRSAQRSERLGYILAGVGIGVVVLGIPLAICFDRRKKARAAKTDGNTPRR